MLSTFLPTVLLWCLAYFTLFIDIENFSDRFIGTVTALLVLVALLSSVNGDLPKTSYFKFIDMWFLWYITSILLIILFHIFLNNISGSEVRPLTAKNECWQTTPGKQENRSGNRVKVNRIGAVMFAITMVLFNGTYFTLAVQN